MGRISGMRSNLIVSLQRSPGGYTFEHILLEQVVIDDELELLEGSQGTEEATWVGDVQAVHRQGESIVLK